MTTRAIGLWGTAIRVAVGVWLAGSVVVGHAVGGWHPVAWLLGLIVFPAVTLGWQWWRARRNPAPLRATGIVGHVVNISVFFALYLTWWYAPSIDVLSDAALLFYGGSMLLAAMRGCAGCEVLAVSNWLLHRHDEIGCMPFWPIDALEARHRPRRYEMRVELLLAPDCPNTAAARTALAEALHELKLTVPMVERVGAFPSPTVLVDGVDVMTDRAGAPEMRACRLDVPTVPKLLAALGGRTPEE